MTEQLDTNTNANASASATVNPDASTDASVSADASEESNADASTEQIEDSAVAEMAERITSVFDQTFAALIEHRDSQYEAAIEDLEKESEALAKEHGQLEADIASLEAVLPSKERLTQHQIDTLLVEGKRYEVKDKLSELAAHKHKPVVMRERQKEITARLEAIQAEKHGITRDIFDEWYTNTVQPTVRGAEKGLFGLLNGLAEDFTEFQSRCGMTRLDNRQRPLLTQAHIVNLTAPEKSAEWIAGHHWYA